VSTAGTRLIKTLQKVVEQNRYLIEHPEELASISPDHMLRYFRAMAKLQASLESLLGK
jgi:hypothetical protein